VGDQSAIGHSDWAVFRSTGVAHLMSISGLHVTLFAWLATALLGRFWRRVGRAWPRALLVLPAPVAAGWGGLALAAAYALFSGWGVPAQRTVLMPAVVVALRLSARQWPWAVVWTLVMAVVVVVLLDPWALMQPGFWLSFVAVGILFASGARVQRGDPLDEPSRCRRWGGAALGMLREQATITGALAPLTLILFGQVSLVGLLANLLAMPWVTLVVTPLALAGVMLPPLWDAAGAGGAGPGHVAGLVGAMALRFGVPRHPARVAGSGRGVGGRPAGAAPALVPAPGGRGADVAVAGLAAAAPGGGWI